MIEPPKPGFTGVVWEAREPDRLARELGTGPGALPMAEAGVAWARLATGFGTAALEYEQILGVLRGAWQSTNSQAVLDRITALRDWLTEAATAAAINASRAETQAAAVELARLAMPDVAEIAAVTQAQQMLAQVGAALGAPVAAIAAHTDGAADVAKAGASRVMRAYEAATEPLSTPWQHEAPPVLATDAALAAEQSGGAGPVSASAAAAGPVLPVGWSGPLGGFAALREKTAYRAPVLLPSDPAEVVETVAPQVVPHATPAGSVPMVPGAVGSAFAGEEEHEPEEYRAGDAGADVIGADLGIVSAPAVLGVPDRPAPAAQATTGGAA
ncbi:PPE domain-containing protein [Nocardia sp. NPDC055029]